MSLVARSSIGADRTARHRGLVSHQRAAKSGARPMLKQAIPNVFVKDFPTALAYYTGPLGFHPLFVHGEIPFYAHVARDEAILAIRHVDRPVIDHTAGEDLLSAFIEVSDVEALHETLRAAGAHIRQPPRDEPWDMRSLIVSDLDGNLICFASNLTS
jgi:catechol 2,3-dioxygenase-like lactoylglutathione lyase family enzyme